MTGEFLREVLADHYSFGQDIKVHHVRGASGSTNKVSVIRITCPQRPPFEAAIRQYDTESPRYEPELLVMESAVRKIAHRASLLVDTVVPSRSGDDHVRAGRFVYSLHRLLPGESLTWEQWAAFQWHQNVPECLGGLQALWDERVGRASPDDLLALVSGAEWAHIGGPGDLTERLAQTFIEQSRLGPRLDLAGRTNVARVDWAAGAVEQHATAWPRYARLFDRWSSRLRRWAAEFDERQADRSTFWLQHGDPSPTNTFFLPQVREWRAIGGITDFELARFASFRSDIGVAGSLRLGDTPGDAELQRVLAGMETDTPLDLRLLERYLSGYHAMTQNRHELSADEIVVGLRSNVLGLALWSVQMMRAAHLDDTQLTIYLATQLHRYMARRATPPEKFHQAAHRACRAAASTKQEVAERLSPAIMVAHQLWQRCSLPPATRSGWRGCARSARTSFRSSRRSTWPAMPASALSTRWKTCPAWIPS